MTLPAGAAANPLKVQPLEHFGAGDVSKAIGYGLPRQHQEKNPANAPAHLDGFGQNPSGQKAVTTKGTKNAAV